LKRFSGNGFNKDAYRRRLRLLREIYSGDNQVEFAKRLGIPYKRWSNYELGYPVPRETAWIIMEKCKGTSVEWLWFGITGNLSTEFKQKLRAVEATNEALQQAAQELERAQNRMKTIAEKRKAAINPPPVNQTVRR
jgi:hypothetical protein